MLPRTVFSSLALLILAITLLVSRAAPTQARAAMQLTPPPLASPAAPFGRPTSQPTEAITATAAITDAVTSTVTLTVAPEATLVLLPTFTPTVELTPTPTITVTQRVTTVTIIRPTATSFILPTVTPTPQSAIALLPTPTPTRAPTDLPTAQPTAKPTKFFSPTATPTVAPTDQIAETIQVTATTAQEITPTSTPPEAITDSSVELPSPFITLSVPLPASYQAQGSFASQTVYTDSTIAQQQGSFTIIQSADLNAYGANQRYTLRTQRAVGEVDEINVYQIDDYIAVNYTGGDWMLVRRDQGSNIVRAIQPITDLAVLFPRIIDQAEFIGQEEIGGISSLRYRIDDPNGQGARLIQPLLALTGVIRSLKLEVWIAVPGGFVVAYNFQVELAGARVLDAASNEARADQAVTWTYQLTPSDVAQPIEWPADAPTPDAFPVPGFAPGDFPIPPNTELLSLVGGVPDLVSTQTLVQIDSFYRTELFTLGWTVEGEGGLLRCSKEGANFQLLIAADTTSNGTRISILPGE